MLLHRLLDHDLHRAKTGVAAVPLLLETPAKTSFLPAVVSTSDSGRFLTSRRLTKEGRIRSGTFSHDPEKMDELIPSMLAAAFSLSVEEGFPNLFKTAGKAFDYIQSASGAKAHPHIALVPAEWLGDEVDTFFGKDEMADSNGNIYRRICRVIPADVKYPVFFSRPDFVGMYIQFLGGRASIILHNVKNGIAFVPPAEAPQARTKADVRR